MKKACLIAIVACFSVLFTGCGSSSSDDGNGTLPTTDIVVDACDTNGCQQPDQAQSCQAFNQSGQSIFNTNAQSTCYPTGNNGQYQESQFGFQGGACQCDPGFIPFRQTDGSLGCLRKESVVKTEFLATVTFSSGKIVRNNNGNKKKKSWNESSFDFILNQGGSTVEQIRPGAGNCYQNIPVGCDLNDPYSCSHVSQPGYPASCVASNGGQYGVGICVNQSIATQ